MRCDQKQKYSTNNGIYVHRHTQTHTLTYDICIYSLTDTETKPHNYAAKPAILRADSLIVTTK